MSDSADREWLETELGIPVDASDNLVIMMLTQACRSDATEITRLHIRIQELESRLREVHTCPSCGLAYKSSEGELP